MLSRLSYKYLYSNMTDFDPDASTEICYPNDTTHQTISYESYENLMIIFEFSALFHAFFFSLLIVCVVKLRKQAESTNEGDNINDQALTETVIQEVQVSYPKLGRFLSLVAIKL